MFRLDLRVVALAVGCFIVGLAIGTTFFWRLWNLPPSWGDVPTWFAVIIGAVGGGIALTQLRGQSKVIKRDAEDRRRQQAMSVYVMPFGGVGRAGQPYAKNASQYPVFDAKLWYRPDGPPDSLGDPDDLGVVMPGEMRGTQDQIGEQAVHATVILSFRDANGVRWIRMPGGGLLEQAKPTARDSVIAALTSAHRVL